VLFEIQVRWNIPVTNWKELSISKIHKDTSTKFWEGGLNLNDQQ
jgi:hypothetical protein